MGTSFGRGGATQSLQDMANADCIVIQGSNMAECHPVGFQWVEEAKSRGAKISDTKDSLAADGATSVGMYHFGSAEAQTAGDWCETKMKMIVCVTTFALKYSTD